MACAVGSIGVSGLVRRFETNTVGRDLIVGDIHGCFTKLRQALDEVCFSPETGDRLFSVGDLVDRGPESPLAVEWLQQPWFHAVQGNHEDMAIRWPNGNMDPGNYTANGGGWNVSNSPEACRALSECFAMLPVAMELKTATGLLGIVHADCPFGAWQDFIASLEDATLSKSMLGAIVDAAQWSRERIASTTQDDVSGVRAVVVGHTPMQRFTSLGNVLNIDTGGWLTRGHFTILDAATLRPATATRMNWSGT